MGTVVDFAQTVHARRNRQAKAERLAARAAVMGFQPYELTMPDRMGTLADQTRRERVRKDLGLRSRPSDATWSMALDLLEVATRSHPGARPCPACGWAVVTVRTPKGDVRDLDPFAHPGGTVHIRHGEPHPVAIVITGTDTPPDDTPLFRQHARSCPGSPQAADRRRREAPRCTVCDQALDGYVALMVRDHTAHPTCEGR